MCGTQDSVECVPERLLCAFHEIAGVVDLLGSQAMTQ